MQQKLGSNGVDISESDSNTQKVESLRSDFLDVQALIREIYSNSLSDGYVEVQKLQGLFHRPSFQNLIENLKIDPDFFYLVTIDLINNDGYNQGKFRNLRDQIDHILSEDMPGILNQTHNERFFAHALSLFSVIGGVAALSFYDQANYISVGSSVIIAMFLIYSLSEVNSKDLDVNQLKSQLELLNKIIQEYQVRILSKGSFE